MPEGGVMMATRGCASLTPAYKPRLRLGVTCFACHRHIHLSGVCNTPPTFAATVDAHSASVGDINRGAVTTSITPHWRR